MSKFFLSPPVAFVLFLAISFLISKATSFIAAKGKVATGKTAAYACGEETVQNRARPEYRQFFHIAFFFTIMHVIALIVATDPNGLTPLSGIYIGTAFLALIILFRR